MIRILLADDHRIVRDGLRSLLDAAEGREVVGEATNGREAVKLARQLRPELVIIDVAMPELNGIDAARQIRKDNPDTRVIALSMHSDASYVGKILQAGASGYLLKDCAFEELTEAIAAVLAGKVFLSPGITGVVVEDYVRALEHGDKRAPTDVLTPKEREVLQLIAEGKSTKEIAAALFVSVKTIETHRQNIMGKLDIRSIAELTKYAIRTGLTSLDN